MRRGAPVRRLTADDDDDDVPRHQYNRRLWGFALTSVVASTELLRINAAHSSDIALTIRRDLQQIQQASASLKMAVAQLDRIRPTQPRRKHGA